MHNVLEHRVKSFRKRADLRISDRQQEVVVVLHPLEGIHRDSLQGSRDLNLFEFRSKRAEYLVGENVRGLQNLRREAFQAGKTRDN